MKSPFRLKIGSRSKKLVTDSHSSKPNTPGLCVSLARIGTPGPRSPLRCHLPKCPVAYPTLRNASGNGLLLSPQSVPVAVHTCSHVRSTGQHAGASWRANRRSSIESIEPQASCGHRVQMRSLQDRVIVVSRLPPALVVCHHEHNIRAGRIAGQNRTRS